MKHGIHQGIDEQEYHQDPAFSQSRAKVLLESPARYRWQLTEPPVVSEAFDNGHAVHAKVLGVGLPVIAIPDDLLDARGGLSKKDCKEFVEKARGDGLTPIKSEVLAEVDAMAEAVLSDPHARAAFEAEGDVELSMWWADPDSGVECRGRVDKVAATADGISLVDLKSTADGSPRGFASSAAKFGYRLQGGAYDDGWTILAGEPPASFLFVTVEKAAPYLVGTYSLSPFDVDTGRWKWREACARLADYTARDHWPSYAADLPPFSPLTLPAWAL